MDCTFKIGDVIWAKDSKHSFVFYHRPCRVLSIGTLGIRVDLLGGGGKFTVDKDDFELVPKGGILKRGDILIHKETKEKITFLEYYYRDLLYCRNSNNSVRSYNIKELERGKRADL